MTFKNVYIYTNLFILIVGGGLLMYWYLFDGVVNPVIDVKSDPMAMELVQDHYHRGDVVYAYFSFCKLRDIPVTTNWRLVDGEIILLLRL